MSGPRQLVTSKRTATTHRPELVLAPGPLVLAQPGAGTVAALYGSAWAFALYKDGPQLLQLQGGAWVERSDPDATAGLTGAEHLSLAFDQAARPVLAWHAAGQVYVRQWDGTGQQYATRGPFPGRDPVLFSDAPLLDSTADSDVLLLYLNGQTLTGRIQRDLYGLPLPLLTLEAGAVLDQIVQTGVFWQVLGTLGDGPTFAATSPAYPLRFVDGMSGAAFLTGYVEDVLKLTQGADGLTGTAALVGLLENVGAVSVYTDSMTGAATLNGLLEVVAVERLVVDALSGAALLAGSLEIIVVSSSSTDALSGAATLTGELILI